MVTFGSLLLWAMAKALVPDNSVARTAAAVGSSIILLKTGIAYAGALDAAVTKASE